MGGNQRRAKAGQGGGEALPWGASIERGATRRTLNRKQPQRRQRKPDMRTGEGGKMVARVGQRNDDLTRGEVSTGLSIASSGAFWKAEFLGIAMNRPKSDRRI